jgi:hypothetical protein
MCLCVCICLCVCSCHAGRPAAASANRWARFAHIHFTTLQEYGRAARTHHTRRPRYARTAMRISLPRYLAREAAGRLRSFLISDRMRVAKTERNVGMPLLIGYVCGCQADPVALEGAAARCEQRVDEGEASAARSREVGDKRHVRCQVTWAHACAHTTYARSSHARATRDSCSCTCPHLKAA